MIKKIFFICCFMSVCLTGCIVEDDVITAENVGIAQQKRVGVVLNVKEVKISRKTKEEREDMSLTVLGAASGGAFGAMATDSVAGGVLGSVIGGTLGNIVGKGATQNGRCYSIKMCDNNEVLTITQEEHPVISVGQYVAVDIDHRTGKAKVTPHDMPASFYHNTLQQAPSYAVTSPVYVPTQPIYSAPVQAIPLQNQYIAVQPPAVVTQQTPYYNNQPVYKIVSQ